MFVAPSVLSGARQRLPPPAAAALRPRQVGSIRRSRPPPQAAARRFVADSSSGRRVVVFASAEGVSGADGGRDVLDVLLDDAQPQSFSSAAPAADVDDAAVSLLFRTGERELDAVPAAPASAEDDVGSVLDAVFDSREPATPAVIRQRDPFTPPDARDGMLAQGLLEGTLGISVERSGLEPCLGGALTQKAVFVDEITCIGCTNCAMTGDLEDVIQEAIDTCPVECISWVPFHSLSELEEVRDNTEMIPVGCVGETSARFRRKKPVKEVRHNEYKDW
eukprot:tig00000525_g1945.t1